MYSQQFTPFLRLYSDQDLGTTLEGEAVSDGFVFKPYETASVCSQTSLLQN